MPTPCRILSVFPRYYPLFRKLFLKEDSTYIYERIKDAKEREIELKIYCEPQEEDALGISCNIYIDLPHYFFNRDEGSVIVKSTNEVFIKNYIINSDNLIALFTSRNISHRLQYAFLSIARQYDPSAGDMMIPIILDLKGKERELNIEFSEVRRFWMKDMPDIYIRGAGITGVRLQDSPEYTKYVRRLGGKLMSIVFRWQGITILLSSDGLIFTYTNFPSNTEAAHYFKVIIDKLIKVDALEYLI